MSAGGPGGPGLATVADAPLVGREPQLEALAQCGADAAAGQPVTCLIGGDAGIGKSRLVREFLARATAAGATGLVGGCLDLADRGLPFWPFVEAIRASTSELDDDDRAELLDPGGPELARVLPELTGEASAPLPALGASDQGRLFELLLGLLGRLAQRAPLVLVVEDIHWADRSTLDLLAYLSRTLRSERMLLVATHRRDELYRGHPLRAFLAELYRARTVRRLDLDGLTREEMGEHLAHITGGRATPELVESVYERSEGNPFYAEELVAASSESEGAELPPTLRDILLARVDRRSPALREILRIASVGGRRVPVGLLAEVCPLPPGERTESLREAVAHNLLVTDGPSAYAFSHALLREAVYQELLPGEREERHRRYGEALSAQPGLAGDDAVVAGQLAHHWFEGKDLPRALAASVRAGQVAEGRRGFAEAGTHYARALELWSRVADAEERTGLDELTLARTAAEVANLAGDHGRASELIRGAIERAEPGEAGLLWERLGRYLWAAGDAETALDAYAEALRLVPAEPPSAARARVLAARGQSLMLMARFEEARDCCEDAIAIARAVGARAEEGHALNTLGCSLTFVGDPGGAVAHLRAALAIANEVGDLDDIGRAYQNLSNVLGGPLNRLDDALAVALEGRRVMERAGLSRDYGVSLDVNAAAALLALGRWQEADAIIRAAEERRPSDTAAVEVHLSRAWLEVARGSLEEGARHIDEARAVMDAMLDPQFQASVGVCLAELRLWEHRVADARDAAAAGLEGLEDGEDSWFIAPLLWLSAWAHAEAGSEAPALMRRADELVEAAASGAAFVSPVTVAYARMCRAEGQRLTDPGAAEPWRAAAAAWEAVGHPYRLAHARWREAEALLARRRRRDGAAALGAAHAIARRLRAGALEREIELLARRARIDLAAAGESSEPSVAAGEGHARAAGLTKRERQVLALIADGRTNREIAEALFVTEKTAAAHVSSILGKLRVRSRVEAATAAHRLGLLAER